MDDAVTSMGRHAAMLSTLAVALAAPGEARAAEQACAPAPVEIDPAVGARWPELPRHLRDALEGRDDLDRCARIAIHMNAAAIALEVGLPDGRVASRAVSRGEDVVPTLEALLLLPSGPRQPVGGAAPEEPTAAPPPPSPTSGGATVLSAVVEPTPPPAPRFRLESSLATGARIGDGQVGLSLGALTVFDLRGWLLGFEGAVDHYENTGAVASVDALALGLLAGRRFRFEPAMVDLTVGPAVALPGIGNRSAVKAEAGSSGGQAPPPADDGPRARLLAGARVIFRPRSLVRPFGGVEAELGLGKTGTGFSPGELPLPRWVVGLVAGATVGTP